jgi:type IV pilus assembly protein PilE
MLKQLFPLSRQLRFNTIQGFTLLEVLIALGIVLILSYLSSASYHHYIIKASRINAKVALLNARVVIENYYSQYHTYAGIRLDALGIPSFTDDGRYRIVLTQLSQTSYLIKATPYGPQVSDNKCGALMCNEQGERFISGTASVNRCWS